MPLTLLVATFHNVFFPCTRNALISPRLLTYGKAKYPMQKKHATTISEDLYHVKKFDAACSMFIYLH